MTTTSIREGLSTDVHTPELLDCVYGLNDRDKAVFQAIHRATKECTADEIAAQLGCDRSTAHRSLSRLVELDIVIQRRVESKHGYYYEYRLREPEEIAHDMQALLNDWYSVTDQLIRQCDFSTEESSISQK